MLFGYTQVSANLIGTLTFVSKFLSKYKIRVSLLF